MGRKTKYTSFVNSLLRFMCIPSSTCKKSSR